MAITYEAARVLMRRAGRSEEQIDSELGEKQPGKNKFNAKRTYSDVIGRHFHSDAERRFAEVLWWRQEAGEISDLTFQCSVKLLGCIAMRPDFRYVEDGETIWHEFKGFATDKWRLQKKVWEQVGPGEYRISYERKNGYRTDVIFPQPGDELVALVQKHLQPQEVNQ